jgi:hypothetical protein
MFWQAGYQQQQLQALSICRLEHHLIFLSDMTLACGQNLDLLLLAPPSPGSAKRRLSYVFPKLHQSRTDWKLWFDFWTSTTGNRGLLYIPLGEWIHKTHRTWQWYYDKYNDILYQKEDDTVTAFICKTACARVRSLQKYYQADDIDVLPEHCVPANVILTRDGTVHRKNIGPPLAKTTIGTKSFWTYLKSLGGE